MTGQQLVERRVHPLVRQLLEVLELEDVDVVEIVLEPGILAALHVRRHPTTGDLMLEPGTRDLWLESTSIEWRPS